MLCRGQFDWYDFPLAVFFLNFNINLFLIPIETYFIAHLLPLMLHGKFKFYLIVSLKKSIGIKKDLKKDLVFPLSQAWERKN